jgi:phosphate transport system substrate-binding protein
MGNSKINTKILTVILISIISISCKENSKTRTVDSFLLNIDGSSTVYPITNSIIETYKKENEDINFNINVNGTGDGLQKFVKNKIQFCNASRPMNESEKQACTINNVKYREIKIGFDGIAVVVNNQNTWITGLTIEQLIKVWSEHDIKWSDLNSEWPAVSISKYSPGSSSGTSDYFKEVILKDLEFSEDIIKSENDNLLVKGVESSINSIGFFGYSYYEKNRNDLKIVPIRSTNIYVIPSLTSIDDGSYQPLSRPLFIYVNEEFVNEKSGKKFLEFFLKNITKACLQNGAVPQSDAYFKTVISRLNN